VSWCRCETSSTVVELDCLENACCNQPKKLKGRDTMPEEMQNLVWLEQVGGTKVDLRKTCSIGRAPSNQIVLSDEKVSRRHAIVHAQGANEFWLVDLGSSNGTYVNGHHQTVFVFDLP
jgi:pSer/pThr/pTyr-binding forkhead associated (FHA) protein